MKTYYVYILASKRNGTLYIGVTSDLVRRISEHKNKLVDGFSKKYNVNMLVHFESTNDIYSALVKRKTTKSMEKRILIGRIYPLNFSHNREWIPAKACP